MATQPASSKQRNILIVNDRQEILDSIARFLSQHDEVQVVGTARGLAEAVDSARLLQPEVVVCDYSLLRPSTLERISLLRQTLPQACIIVMSYDDESEAQQSARDAGANDFISKFNLADDLLPALQRCSALI